MRPRIASRPGPAVLLLLLASGAVYASCLGYFFFGRVGDDARHWLAALSLLQGRYVDLAHPALPPLAIPPPGYPILLLPAAALGSILLGQWLNIGFLLGATLATLRLLRNEPAVAFAAAALAALNPLTVLQASSLMSDPAFALFSLASLAALSSVVDGGSSSGRRVLACALLAAAAAWIRAQGVVVIAASLLILMESPALRRHAWSYAGASIPLALAPYAWSLVRSDPSTTYFAHLTTTAWSRGSPAAELARAVLLNLRYYSSAATTRTVASWVAPIPGESSWLAWAAELALLALLGRELARAFRERGTPRLLAAYLVLYFGLHLFWTNQFRRYLLPVLPLLYWLLLRPLARHPRWLAPCALALAAFFAAFDGLLAWRSESPRANENVPPRETFAWLEKHAKPGEVLAAPYRETFSYYTGHPVIDFHMLADPDDWLHQLTRYRIRLIVSHPEGETMESVRAELLAANAQLSLRRLSDPSRFKPAYRASGEPFVVYEVVNGDRFERGYVHLSRARELIAAGELARAAFELESARRTGAALERLPFYLGTTELLLGRPAPARRWLEEALRREPGFAPAAANLARLKAAGG